MHLGDVAEPNQPPRAGGDDEPREVGRLFEASAQANRALVERALQPPDRRREVLCLQRLHHLSDADAGRLQRGGTQLHRHLTLDAADDLHFGDAGRLRRRRVMPGSAISVSSAADALLRGERERHDRHVVGIEPREDRLLHFGGEIVADAGDLVPDLLGGLLQVLLEVRTRP